MNKTKTKQKGVKAQQINPVETAVIYLKDEYDPTDSFKAVIYVEAIAESEETTYQYRLVIDDKKLIKEPQLPETTYAVFNNVEAHYLVFYEALQDLQGRRRGPIREVEMGVLNGDLFVVSKNAEFLKAVGHQMYYRKPETVFPCSNLVEALEKANRITTVLIEADDAHIILDEPNWQISE